MTPEQIAKGLTKAQREAVRRARDMYQGEWVIPELRDVRTLSRLLTIGVAHRGGIFPELATLTPLGLAVRAALESA
ncbi:hypothetical protein U2181_15360, partial [Listeria monocytogenes]|uniref:hypothetical protein n=1 Tax=Listeria monocytogenes TaxID=1639 RepID=UPI002FDC4548